MIVRESLFAFSVASSVFPSEGFVSDGATGWLISGRTPHIGPGSAEPFVLTAAEQRLSAHRLLISL
jgi:hypothetical protein